jgi:hypothetical protein
MRRAWSLLAVLTLLVSIPLPLLAQTYEGDQVCGTCHANMPYQGFFDGYMRTGHPWKLYHAAGTEPAPDTWPFTPVPPLPTVGGQQLDWSDIEYVIGNYFWKARFIGRDGYIITGEADDATQWNIQTQEWVPYHPGELKPYNCGRCHTTGYDPNGHQGDLPGIEGTWFQDGIRCEACHGPGSDHVDSFGGVPPPGGLACSDCHYRDSQYRMPWKNGFMRHHQQAEEFSHSSHKNVLTCVSCHNPHKSTVYQEGGVTVSCSDCHPGNPDNNYYIVAGMEDVDCIECHMPYMAKSAVAWNTYKADIRGHLFRITTLPIAAEDNVYEQDGVLYWNQDENGDSFITLDYACLGCHIEIGQELTLEDAAAFAEGIHQRLPSDVADAQGVSRVWLRVLGSNPGAGRTILQYALPEARPVRMVLVDVEGRTVRELVSGTQDAGVHAIAVEPQGLTSGLYFCRLEAGPDVRTQKLVILK